ncbi:hypothetical protein [Adhaeribacter radiodurans]|nr:hypothetical protein [Adhaeribacter radiodurans]
MTKLEEVATIKLLFRLVFDIPVFNTYRIGFFLILLEYLVNTTWY